MSHAAIQMLRRHGLEMLSPAHNKFVYNRLSAATGQHIGSTVAPQQTMPRLTQSLENARLHSGRSRRTRDTELDGHHLQSGSSWLPSGTRLAVMGELH